MCGIAGVHGHEEAAHHVYLSLYALQHRGQEATGIVSSNGRELFRVRKRSLVADAYGQEVLDLLEGRHAIGHDRYSTTGESRLANAQPLTAEIFGQEVALVHNGNITNHEALAKDVKESGALFQTSTDTEIILHLMARHPSKSIEKAFMDTLNKLEGAVSVIMLTQNEMYASRDPWGFRPLAMGTLGKSHVFSSESCAFDLIDARFERELEPGEVVVIRQDHSLESFSLQDREHKQCVFEHVYFARPDSITFGKNNYEIRKRIGAALANEYDKELDMVISVPDSGNIMALGFAQEKKIPFELGLIRNHYVGRTFIEPSQSIRGLGVRLKLNPVAEILKGKRIGVIDDSIVRGTTSKKIIKMIQGMGAKEVHMLIGSPPFSHPCFYGIDTPSKKELLSANHTHEEMMSYIGCDRLHFLSREGLLDAVGSKSGYCDACFSGNYPTECGK